MEERMKKILFNEYNLNVDRLDSIEGGYRSDQTYLVLSSNQLRYLLKSIKYSSTFEYLRSILQFQNMLYHCYEYPCSQIILSNKDELLICDNDRFLFLQTYIHGIEPSKEILEKDDRYLKEMGRLLAIWRMASRQYSSNIQSKIEEELTDQWWKDQQIDNIDPFLLSNFMECKQYLTNSKESLERGLIHNDFHTNNSLITNDGKIFVIDFVDACQSVFVADLATSLFHLLINEQTGEQRAQFFLLGYEEVIQLSEEERNLLDLFVRLKLTLSIIEDLKNSDDINQPFIQSCFHLLHILNDHPNFVKRLLKQ